jgi:hypothetical protein
MTASLLQFCLLIATGACLLMGLLIMISVFARRSTLE